jgi:hypothetical protein
VSAHFRKTWTENGRIDFSDLAGYDFQPEHTLEALLRTYYHLEQDGNLYSIRCELYSKTAKLHHSKATGYYFELMLLSGNPINPFSLRMETEISSLYAMNTVDTCRLNMQVPEDQPWMLMLKMSCLEGNELAKSSRHYGMKVIAVG